MQHIPAQALDSILLHDPYANKATRMQCKQKYYLARTRVVHQAVQIRQEIYAQCTGAYIGSMPVAMQIRCAASCTATGIQHKSRLPVLAVGP